MSTVTQEVQELTTEFGKELFAPVIHRWLLALHQHIAYFEDGDTTFLYCARAGVRIKKLYDMFLEGEHISEVVQPKMFWVSRLAIGKGTYAKQPENVLGLIGGEYFHATLRELIQGLLRNDQAILKKLNLTGKEFDAKGSTFPDWLKTRSSVAKVIHDYLMACSERFDGYLQELMAKKSRVVLIDSGWQGTSQSLLTHAFPKNSWKGLYFGRAMMEYADHSILPHIIGLMFEADNYDPKIPASAFVLHRHLIETLLEPNGPSVEDIYFGSSKASLEPIITANETDDWAPENEPLLAAVLEYLEENADLTPVEIVSRAQVALPKLAKWIVYPSREQALATKTKHRSADFGKDFVVPVLLSNDHPNWTDPDVRVHHALWTNGQIALEYSGGIAGELQARAAGQTSASASFDPRAQVGKEQEPAGRIPTVAVITRTKNRPLLLERAAQSVAKQTYPAVQWVVVNDGGDETAVRDVIEKCQVDRRHITLVSNSSSLGMEAASNVGIQNSQSDYIVIHDDDDSWSPEFVSSCVERLEGPAAEIYGGAITGTTYVSEEIKGGVVTEHHKAPYNQWVRNVQLPEMMRGNFFAPIAFMYRRSVYDDIGGYNEHLPVLGDWFFNLEFLLRADIAVIEEPLAFYHHRDVGDSSRSGVYSNSVIGGRSKHEEYGAIARNMLMRKYAENNAIVGGMIDGYFAADISHKLSLLPASSSDPAAYIIPDYNEIDRLWLLTHLIQHRRQRVVWLLRGMRPPNADTPWSQINSFWNFRLNLRIHPSFHEDQYLRINEDVADSVKKGLMGSGYEHYLKYGRSEKRARANRT